MIVGLDDMHMWLSEHERRPPVAFKTRNIDTFMTVVVCSWWLSSPLGGRRHYHENLGSTSHRETAADSWRQRQQMDKNVAMSYYKTVSGCANICSSMVLHAIKDNSNSLCPAASGW